MASLIKKTAAAFTAIFLLLFALRLGYGYATQPNGEVIQRGVISNNLGYDFELSRKNYAGQKGSVGPGPSAVDQRYEKVATLGQSTDSFTEDEAKVRGVAEDVDALIQHEQSFGLDGRRQLQLALGVPPDRFDQAIAELRAIGKAVSFQVNKTDKTNEYRALLAQQDSLKKSRDNLIELKNRDAELDAMIALEGRILDLENQIQSLGVSVGEFDSEFEFVTIKLTVSEVPPAIERFIPFLQRAKVALEWTILATLGIAAAFFVAMIAAALLVFVLKSAQNVTTKENST